MSNAQKEFTAPAGKEQFTGSIFIYYIIMYCTKRKEEKRRGVVFSTGGERKGERERLPPY
jgi:hypothetical protein